MRVYLPSYLSTRLLETFTVIYLVIPSVIFAVGWLRPLIWLPLLAVVFTGVAIWLRAVATTPERVPAGVPPPVPLKTSNALLALAGVVVVAAHLGTAGWGTPSGDTRYRSYTVFRDLVEKPWPVIYTLQDFQGVPSLSIELKDRSEDSDIRVRRGIIIAPNSGFVVSNPGTDLVGITGGTSVVLAGSGPRIVKAIDGDRVWLEAGPIDPIVDGFPNTVTVDWNDARQTKPLVLVYSVGLFLPASLVGKWLGWDAANHVLFVWTAMGLWLGVCWFLTLAGRWLWASLAILLFFGGLDVVGQSLLDSWLQRKAVWPQFSQHVEWWAGEKRFSFQSTISNVHNGAQHFIPGFIPPLLAIYQIVYRRRTESVLLLVALTFIWAPMVFLGIAPIIGALMLTAKWRGLITFPNVVAAPVLTLILWLFYAKPAGAIQHDWVWQVYGLSTLPIMLLFWLIEFGLYAVLVHPYTRTLAPPFKHLWLVMLASLCVASLYMFGWSSDISLRMSIALLNVFIVFIILAVYWMWDTKRYWRLAALGTLLFVGSWAGSIDAHLALRQMSYPRIYQTPPTDMGVLHWVYWIPHPNLKVIKNLFLSDERNAFLRCCLKEPLPSSP